MLRRRPLLRAAAVGGVAYSAGHHMATKSAEQQYTDAQQSAQIADLQQEQPVYQQPAPPPPVYQQASSASPGVPTTSSASTTGCCTSTVWCYD